MSYITIKQKEFIRSYQVCKVCISLNNLTLGVNAEFLVDVFDITGLLVDRVYYMLEGEEYNNWSNDDNYISDLILTKLGYEKS